MTPTRPWSWPGRPRGSRRTTRSSAILSACYYVWLGRDEVLVLLRRHEADTEIFRNTLGVAHYRLGRYREAVEALRRSRPARGPRPRLGPLLPGDGLPPPRGGRPRPGIPELGPSMEPRPEGLVRRRASRAVVRPRGDGGDAGAVRPLEVDRVGSRSTSPPYEGRRGEGSPPPRVSRYQVPAVLELLRIKLLVIFPEFLSRVRRFAQLAARRTHQGHRTRTARSPDRRGPAPVYGPGSRGDPMLHITPARPGRALQRPPFRTSSRPECLEDRRCCVTT